MSSPSWPTAGAPSSGTPPTANLVTLVNYYVARLIFQYANKPRAQGLIALLTKQALADDMATQMVAAFQLDTAVGPQLDILGKYIGVARNVGTPVLPGLFSLWSYGSVLAGAEYQGSWDPSTDTPTLPAAAVGNTNWWYVALNPGTSTAPIADTFRCGDIVLSNGSVWSKDVNDCGNGLTTYSDLSINANGIFYGYAYASQQVNSLSDVSYRALLKLQSIVNINDSSLPSIMSLLAALFPSAISLQDNDDMTMAYTVLNTVPLTVDVLQKYLPRPMSVGITVTVVSPSPASGDDITTEGGSPLVTEPGGSSPLVTES